MRHLVLLICFSYIISGAFSQAFETVGAGVIDFLVSNPTTANRMNSTEKAGLTVMGNLLNIAGQRKHDMNIATAGRQQVIIQETTGKQAEIALDPDGNMYVYYNGMVVPLNSSIIKQAKEEFAPKYKAENEYLPPYKIQEIRETYKFLVPKDMCKPVFYTVTNPRGMYLYQIANKFETNKYRIYPSKGYSNSYLRRLRKSKTKIYQGGEVKININCEYIKTKIPFLFSCKWAKDFDDDGFDFDDFQEIKNSFYKDEEILIVSGYQTNKDSCVYSIEVYQAETGQLLFRREGEAPPIYEIIQEQISAEVLAPGRYLYVCKLSRNKETLVTRRERFEIRNEKYQKAVDK